MLMTSHFPDHAFLTSGRVILMHAGRMYGYGLPEKFVTESGLREVFGVDVEIMVSGSGAKVCVPRIAGEISFSPQPPATA